MATIKAGVKIDASSAERSNKILHDLNESLKNMQKNFEELSDIVGAGTKDLDSFAKKTASTSTIGKVFHSIFDKIKSMFGSLGAVVATVEKAFGKFGIEVGLTTFGLERLAKEGAKVEQLHARLLTMVGSNRFANAMTGWIREMTTKLPIAREDLYDMVSQLSVFGVTPTFKQTATVLGTAALAGKTFAQAFQEIFAVMDPTNTKKINDLVQSFNWRIPQSALMNMQIMLARTDPMNYAKRWQIVTDALSGFASGGIYLANTAQGMLQRIHASLEIFFENIGTAFLPQLKSVYGAILNFFDKNKKTLVKVASEIGSTIGNLISIMKFLVKPLVDIFVTIKNIIFGQGDIFKNVVAPMLVISAGLAVKARSILDSIKQFFIDLTTGHFLKALGDLLKVIGKAFDLLWTAASIVLIKIRNRLSELLKQMGIEWAIGPAQAAIIYALSKIGIKAFTILKNIMLWPAEILKSLTSASKLNETMSRVATTTEKAAAAMQSMAAASSTAAVASSAILASTVATEYPGLPPGWVGPEWGKNYKQTAGGIFVPPAMMQGMNEETEKASESMVSRFLANFGRKLSEKKVAVLSRLSKWGISISNIVGFVMGSTIADKLASSVTNDPVLITGADMIGGYLGGTIATGLAIKFGPKLVEVLAGGLRWAVRNPAVVGSLEVIVVTIVSYFVNMFRKSLVQLFSVGVGSGGILDSFRRYVSANLRILIEGLSIPGALFGAVTSPIVALFTGDWSGVKKSFKELIDLLGDLMMDIGESFYRSFLEPVYYLAGVMGISPARSRASELSAFYLGRNVSKKYGLEEIPKEKIRQVPFEQTIVKLANEAGFKGDVYKFLSSRIPFFYESGNKEDLFERFAIGLFGKDIGKYVNLHKAFDFLVSEKTGELRKDISQNLIDAATSLNQSAENLNKATEKSLLNSAQHGLSVAYGQLFSGEYGTSSIPENKLTANTIGATLLDIAQREGKVSFEQFVASAIPDFDSLSDNAKKEVFELIVRNVFPQDYGKVKSILTPEFFSEFMNGRGGFSKPGGSLLRKQSSFLDFGEDFYGIPNNGKFLENPNEKLSGEFSGIPNNGNYNDNSLEYPYGTSSDIDFANMSKDYRNSIQEEIVKKYAPIVIKEAKAYGLKPSIVLALISTESSWNPYARSNKGAYGFTQLKLDTARALGVDINDPVENIKGGIKYLAQLLKHYKGNYSLALKAYNEGLTNVDNNLKHHLDISSKYADTVMKNAEKWENLLESMIDSKHSKHERFFNSFDKQIGLMIDTYSRNYLIALNKGFETEKITLATKGANNSIRFFTNFGTQMDSMIDTYSRNYLIALNKGFETEKITLATKGANNPIRFTNFGTQINPIEDINYLSKTYKELENKKDTKASTSSGKHTEVKIQSMIMNVSVKDSTDFSKFFSNFVKGIAKVADTVNVEHLGYGNINSESLREVALKLQPYVSVGQIR